MSVPSPSSLRHSEQLTPQRDRAADSTGLRTDATRWTTIRYALDSTARTVRLCAIILVAGVPPVVIALALGLHH